MSESKTKFLKGQKKLDKSERKELKYIRNLRRSKFNRNDQWS